MARKRAWNYQYVWPKDGVKGKEPRGFFGRMNDILTGRGPDMFVDKGGSRTPIKLDEWSNWYYFNGLPKIITYNV